MTVLKPNNRVFVQLMSSRVEGAPTGFHDDLAGSKMHEEAQKTRSSESLALRDPPIGTATASSKDIFCPVNRNDRSILIGLLLVGAFAETLIMLSLAHRCPTAIQEESISIVRASAGQRLRWTKEAVDDLHKSSSISGGAPPRRSTSSLGRRRTV
jgi:hypothetical protein